MLENAAVAAAALIVARFWLVGRIHRALDNFDRRVRS